MPGRSTWRGGVRLSTRTANSFLKIARDAGNEIVGRSLPRTPEQISRPEVINGLLECNSPAGRPTLPRVETARLPGIEFESSNCQNFLVELEFEKAAAQTDLPRTVYVKLPCESLTTRAFANTLGFWQLEYTFCMRVAPRLPIRVPRVYAAAWRGSRFVLLLENLHEIPGVELFINRDMAAGTQPERAERILRGFAQMHAHFWDWTEPQREELLPARFNTYTAPQSREMTRALNASAIGPALRSAPDILTERIGETYRRAIEKWDALLEAWYSGPLTLVHGDSHLGNCFEYPTEEGIRTGLIDFQATHWSKGMRDVQYFLINSLEPDVLIENENYLIGVYCDELAQRGITLTREEAFEQYRAFSFQTLLVGVVPLGLGNLTERNATVQAITRRSAAAVERLQFREWLEGLG